MLLLCWLMLVFFMPHLPRPDEFHPHPLGAFREKRTQMEKMYTKGKCRVEGGRKCMRRSEFKVESRRTTSPPALTSSLLGGCLAPGCDASWLCVLHTLCMSCVSLLSTCYHASRRMFACTPECPSGRTPQRRAPVYHKCKD